MLAGWSKEYENMKQTQSAGSDVLKARDEDDAQLAEKGEDVELKFKVAGPQRRWIVEKQLGESQAYIFIPGHEAGLGLLKI